MYYKMTLQTLKQEIERIGNIKIKDKELEKIK